MASGLVKAQPQPPAAEGAATPVLQPSAVRCPPPSCRSARYNNHMSNTICPYQTEGLLTDPRFSSSLAAQALLDALSGWIVNR
jgi:hypothetical protein